MSSRSESISRVWDACHRNRPDPSYALSMDAEPLVRVLRGEPDAAELAALVTVLTIRSTRTDSRSAPAPTSTWTRSARPAAPPASWRTSGLPR